jgi:hypothetical protein
MLCCEFGSCADKRCFQSVSCAVSLSVSLCIADLAPAAA